MKIAKIFNKSGFTILELTVGMALLVPVLYFSGDMIHQSVSSLKKIEFSSNRKNLANILNEAVFNNTTNCGPSLNNTLIPNASVGPEPIQFGGLNNYSLPNTVASNTDIVTLGLHVSKAEFTDLKQIGLDSKGRRLVRANVNISTKPLRQEVPDTLDKITTTILAVNPTTNKQWPVLMQF